MSSHLGNHGITKANLQGNGKYKQNHWCSRSTSLPFPQGGPPTSPIVASCACFSSSCFCKAFFFRRCTLRRSSISRWYLGKYVQPQGRNAQLKHLTFLMLKPWCGCLSSSRNSTMTCNKHWLSTSQLQPFPHAKTIKGRRNGNERHCMLQKLG